MDKLLLVRLAERADKATGECWTSFDTLATETEMSRRSVIRGIGRLEAGGWLEVVRHPRGNRYRLPEMTRERDGASSATVASCSATESPRQCHSGTPLVATESPNRPEPSKNRKGTGGGRASAPTAQPACPMIGCRERPISLSPEWRASTMDTFTRAADRFRDHWLAQPGAKAERPTGPRHGKLDTQRRRRRWPPRSRASSSGGRKASTQADRQRAMANGVARAVDRRRGAPPAAGGRGDAPPALAAATVIDG